MTVNGGDEGDGKRATVNLNGIVLFTVCRSLFTLFQ